MQPSNLQNKQKNGDFPTDDFISLAQEHYLKDFPNPNRYKCPPAENLLKIAGSSQLPDASLHQHLLQCSPCLKDFREARVSRTALHPAKPHKFRFNFFLSPIPAFGFLLLILGLFAAASVYFWGNSAATGENRQIAANSPNAVSEKIPSESPVLPDVSEQIQKDSAENDASENLLTNARKDIPANSKPEKPIIKPDDKEKLLAKNTFNFDLAATAVRRNENSKEIVHNIPPQTVSLNVKLPKNSPVGDYEVVLLDESHRTLTAGKTVRSNGKNVSFNLDLQNQSGRARLCIAQKNEIPDCIPIKISNDK
jgi:hypothetical protein